MDFEKVGPMNMPCRLSDGRMANFRLFLYRFERYKFDFEHEFKTEKSDYYVVERGDVSRAKNPLMSIRSACSFGHVFNHQRCDCKQQLDDAMLQIGRSRAGVLIYAWNQEGRGVGMWDHVRVVMEVDKGENTLSAYEKLGLPVDERGYEDVHAILKDLRIKKLRLLANNPKKIKGVADGGFVVTRVPLLPKFTKHNRNVIGIKFEKMGHLK